MINIIRPVGDYVNKDAIENVVKYLFNSHYAVNMTKGGYSVLLNNVQSIINSFYLTQKCFQETEGQRILHIVVTFPKIDFNKNDILEVAQNLSIYIGSNFQNVYTIHSGSYNNKGNTHVHFAINTVSNNGSKLVESQLFYNGIKNCIKASTNNEHEVKVNYKKQQI